MKEHLGKTNLVKHVAKPVAIKIINNTMNNINSSNATLSTINLIHVNDSNLENLAPNVAPVSYDSNRSNEILVETHKIQTSINLSISFLKTLHCAHWAMLNLMFEYFVF